jgi:ATP-grasp domain, R2K clade family 3
MERQLPMFDVSSNEKLDINACGIDWAIFDAVLAYGSTQFIRKISQSKIAGCVSFVEENFSAAMWNERLGELMLNCEGEALKAKNVIQFLSKNEGMWHIRPMSEGKIFAGGEFSHEDWVKLRSERRFDEDVVCYLSERKTIEAEWRVWFVDGNVVEVSQYREDRKMKVVRHGPSEMVEFAKKVSKRWLPHRSVVMDVALTLDGFKVVEFNQIFSSGWYAASPEIILDTLWVALKKIDKT